MGINIISTGRYLPKTIITNDDFAKIVDTNDEWITTRTGIKKRHIATDIENYKMGANAAQAALEKANINADEIDMIIASTVTSEYTTPSLASIIAKEINANNAVCMDINCACAGFVYALDLARRYLLDDEIKKVMVVSSEKLSRITDFTDRSTCVLFGDGAGCSIIEKSDKIFTCHMGADVSGVAKLFAKGTASPNPFIEKDAVVKNDIFPEIKENILYMDGREVYKFATKVMPKAIISACEKANITPEDLKLIIPHQANIRIVETAAKNLKISLDKFYTNVSEYGNTSSASIPICLDEVLEKGLIEKGDKICMVGFGAGLTYCAVVTEI